MRRSLPDVKDPAPSAPTPALAPQQRPYSRGERVALLVIVALAAAVRIPALDRAPPGLNQDEAANAWNAWCLLKTGTDQTGTPWPLMYIRALGENRSAIHLYWMIPFQFLGGLNVWTTRLPFAIAGVLTVIIYYWIARRLAGPTAGLATAAILVANPWHVTLSRLGFEATLGPLLVGLALLACLLAGIPPLRAERPPRVLSALTAGLVVGGVCYGYAAVRLFLPAFIGLWFVVTGRALFALLRTPGGRRALGAFVLGAVISFGPLAYYHLRHPEEIAKRAERLWLWNAEDSLGARAAAVAQRYVAHFGLHFLFVEGDHFEMQSPRGFGTYQWYALPLLLCGAAWSVWNFRRSLVARLLLVWLLVYPVGDCLHRHIRYLSNRGQERYSLHALRSGPGLPGLAVVCGAGVAVIWSRLSRRNGWAAWGVAAVSVATTGLLDARFVDYFYGPHNRRPEVCRRFQTDVLAASIWMKPRWSDTDTVFVTMQGMNFPYPVLLVGLDYSPEQFFGEQHVVETRSGWDHYLKLGKIEFIYDRKRFGERVAELQGNARPEKVILILRPRELVLEPSQVIGGPEGEPLLCLYELTL